jgi:tetratricopeptide (TPR) repeat protein
MGRFRAVWVWLLLCGLAVGVCGVSAQVTLNLDDRLSPSDASKRDALLQPGIAALNRGDDAAALRAFLSVLITYPDDLSVLRYSAAAAMGSGQNEQALSLFQRALAQIPSKPWPMRTTIIVLEARMNRWDDFDRDVKVLRQAKKSGMDHGLDESAGFVIDEFESGRARVQAVIYPLQSSRYHTLYRFLLPTWVEITPPPRANAKGPPPAVPARCKDPDFQPHFDVESDDVDQPEFAKAHPDEAKKGARSYTLDSYGTPCSQALVKFYPDGEPTYETVRADVVKALMTPGGPAKP